MKKRFNTKIRKTSDEGGAVRMTDYHGMAPQYLYTSLPQEETPDETQQNEYEEIPVGRWYNALDSSDYSCGEADVVGMKLYQDAPVTYHRTATYDGQTF